MFYTLYIADNYLMTKKIIQLLIVTILRVYYWLSVNTKIIYTILYSLNLHVYIMYIDILLY